MISTEKLFKIGLVTKPYGFDGSILCSLEKVRATSMRKLKFIFILLDGLPVPFLIESIDADDTSAVIKLEDVNSEQQAKKISQKEIYIESSAPKQKEVNSWDELIGYTMVDEKNNFSVAIDLIEEYPAQVIASCTIEGKEVLIPLNDD